MSTAKRVAIIPDLSKEYDREVVQGISRFVHERGHWSIYLHEDAPHKIARLKRWRGDGVIANTDDIRVVRTMKQMRLPMVGFGGGVRDRDIHFLATDDVAIGRLAAEHLLERGFIRFAYCPWPPTRANPWSQTRAQAFGETVRRAGFTCSFFPARASGGGNWNQLLRTLSKWVASLEKPLGLMAADDLRARHVLEACQQIEAAVPDEVAVIGVDNDALICDLSIPPLSSIIQGADRLGFEAASLLDRLMTDQVLPDDISIVVPPVGIVTRQSTDIVAINDADVAAAVRFIRAHAAEAIQVRNVVAQVAVSRATLENRFKRLLGRSVHAEIQRVQMQQVQLLLRSTDLALRKIAERTGFKYEQYLARVFRQYCGQTPGQYRDQVRRIGI